MGEFRMKTRDQLNVIAAASQEHNRLIIQDSNQRGLPALTNDKRMAKVEGARTLK